MRTDPILLEKGLKPPGSAGAHKDIANVLWKLCSEAYPNVRPHNLLASVAVHLTSFLFVDGHAFASKQRA